MVVGNNLKEAKNLGLKKYMNYCKHHGEQAFAVLDNSCPVCVREGVKRRKQQRYDFNRSRELFNEIKKRAGQKRISFNLTLDETRKMLDECSVCPYLGIPITMGNTNMDQRKSLDRIDPRGGYTVDNVVVCSNRANRIKNDATPEELIMIAENIKAIR